MARIPRQLAAAALVLLLFSIFLVPTVFFHAIGVARRAEQGAAPPQDRADVPRRRQSAPAIGPSRRPKTLEPHLKHAKALTSGPSPRSTGPCPLSAAQPPGAEMPSRLMGLDTRDAWPWHLPEKPPCTNLDSWRMLRSGSGKPKEARSSRTCAELLRSPTSALPSACRGSESSS